MNAILLSPLTPAIIFLLGMIACVVVHPARRHWVGQGTAIAVFVTLGIRIAMQYTSSSLMPPLVISAWGAGIGITVRLDAMGTAFLFIPTLLLIAAFWAQTIQRPALVLGMSGAAGLVFVAANGISFNYAIFLFDLFGMAFWFANRQNNLAISRLALSLLTAIVLQLAATLTQGGALLALVLWLRIGLFPFIETTWLRRSKSLSGEVMIWLALSTAVGLYAVGRFLTAPVPQVVQILVAVTVMLSAWLAWVGDNSHHSLHIKLLRVILIQPLLALLISPLPARVTLTLALAYTLSLGALWLTPQIGKPDLDQRHWLWIYGAPALATLTLIGFPWTLGWAAYYGIFAGLTSAQTYPLLAVAILGQGIAFSALYHYWQAMVNGHDTQDLRLLRALFLTIPFLLPVVAPGVFRLITGLDAMSSGNGFSAGYLTGLGITWGLAIGFGRYKSQLLAWLGLSADGLEAMTDFGWGWRYVEIAGSTLAHIILRAKAVFEGGHYLGWAVLIALAGLLIILLN